MRISLDLVELGDQGHRLTGDLAAIELVGLEQLAPGVGHAQRADDGSRALELVRHPINNET